MSTRVDSRVNTEESDRAGVQAPTGTPSRTFRLPILALMLAAAVGTIGAVLGTLAVQRTTYASSVTFVVQSNESANDTEMLVRTYMELIPSEVIGEGLRSKSGVDKSAAAIVRQISVSRPPGAATLTVTYTDESERLSQAVAAQIVPEVRQRTQELNEPAPGQLSTTYSVVPWGVGAVVTDRVDAPLLKNALAGLLAGLVVGLGLLVLRSAFRPLAGRDDETADGFDVVLPRALSLNQEVLFRVAELAQNLQPTASAAKFVVLGPVGDKTRDRFAYGLASVWRGPSAPAEVASAGELGRHDEFSPSVVAGPRTPGGNGWVEVAKSADVVLLLAEVGRSSLLEISNTLTLLDGTPVLTVLLNGSALKLGNPGLGASKGGASHPR